MENKIKIDTIDCDLFLEHFSKYENQLSNTKHCNIQNSSDENSVYFMSPIEFNQSLIEKSNLSKEILKITDLYPVNICIIDFILKNNISEENFKLLDFGCGIPNLLYHLHLIGFKHLYGYDNWFHLNKQYTDEFIQNTGLYNSMIDFEEITLKNITALSHAGCSISEDEYIELLSIPTLEYIFADYRFAPVPLLSDEFSTLTKFEDKTMIVKNRIKKIPESMIRDFGFEPVIIYDGLLLIYKKK